MGNLRDCFRAHLGHPSQGQRASSSTPLLPVLKYGELRDVTDNFSDKIREEVTGPVFSGITSDGGIAVKLVKLFDVLALSVFHHTNLVRFTGFCNHEQDLLLVYEDRRSLSSYIHPLTTGQYFDPQPLDWDTRMEIIVGIAMGVQHLHRWNLTCINLNSCNILLGEGDHVPIITEFSLPTTAVPGTRPAAYNPNFESDVYNFGQVLLEIVSGRRVSEQISEGVNFLTWAKDILDDTSGDITMFQALADTRLSLGYPKEELAYVLDIARSCFHRDPTNRPNMDQIVDKLEIMKKNRHDSRIGSSSTSAAPPRPGGIRPGPSTPPPRPGSSPTSPDTEGRD